MCQLRPALSNNKGVTLAEVMIALVVLLLVFLALMQTALVSISYNMNNVLRDEAVSVADLRMNDARSQTLANLQSDAAAGFVMKHGDGTAVDAATECPPGFTANGVYVERNLKNAATVGFCTYTDVTAEGQTRVIKVTVGWKWKGQDFYHSYTAIRG
jgi:prepilin-type N-terminal cleavage/methylation domain-containing protein